MSSLMSDEDEDCNEDAGKSKISFSEQVRRYKDLSDIMKNGVN